MVLRQQLDSIHNSEIASLNRPVRFESRSGFDLLELRIFSSFVNLFASLPSDLPYRNKPTCSAAALSGISFPASHPLPLSLPCLRTSLMAI